MEIEYIMFAREVVDNADGTKSFLGVFDNMAVKGPPYTYDEPFVVVVKPYVEVGEIGTTKDVGFQVARFMEGRGFEPITEKVEITWKITPDIQRWARAREHLLVDFTGIWFPAPGEYAFQVIVDNQIKKAKNLQVHALMRGQTFE